MKAKTTGNNTVQQNVINWSKRILGNDALTQIKVNIIIELLIPKVKPEINPSKAGLFIIILEKLFKIEIQSITKISHII